MDNSAYTKVNLFRCSRPAASAYVCEFQEPLNVTAKEARAVVTAALSKRWLLYWNVSSARAFSTLSCPKGHVTHTFLACDLNSDCWLEPSGGHSARDGVKCLAPVRPLPPSFDCRERGQRVAYTLVCDHRPDCFDGSDEHFCVFSAGNGSHGDFLCLGDSPFRCGRTKEVC